MHFIRQNSGYFTINIHLLIRQLLLICFLFGLPEQAIASKTENNYDAIGNIISKQQIYIKDIPNPKNLQNKPEKVFENSSKQYEASTFRLYRRPIDISSKKIKKISIYNSKFNNNVTFGDVNMSADDDIQNSISMYFSQFNAPVSFKYMELPKPMVVCRNIFFDRFQFSFSKILTGANWFVNNTFNKAAVFYNSSFGGKTYFDSSDFKGDAIFENDSFHKDVNFKYTKFNKLANFNSTIFNGQVDFSHAQFLGKVSFRNTHFLDHIDLSYLNIPHGQINLNHAKSIIPGHKLYLNIMHSDISKINFSYKKFRLYFPSHVSFEERVQVYTKLLAKYKQLGMRYSYEKLYVEYEQYKLLAKNKFIHNYISKIWWNYGLDKNKIFTWFLFFMLGLTIINSFYYDALVATYFNVPFLNKSTNTPITDKNCVIKYIYNFPQSLLLTFFFVFATFLSILISHTRVFKSGYFPVNIYVILINSIGYVFIMFFIDIILS